MTITNSSTRLAALVAGVAVAIGLMGAVAVAPAQAQAALTAAQVQAIVGLLQSFGADAATIANVTAALNGQPTSGTGGTGSTGGGACPALSRSLQQGSTGADVMALQVFLNGSADTRVAASGAGSPGNETSYFGPATRAAVIKFQTKHGVSAIGIVGPATRAAIAANCGGTSGGGGSVPVTGAGLRVTLAAGSPVNSALVIGQGIGELARFTFANTTNSPITVNSLSFRRVGVSNDSTLSNVYLYQGANRLTDAAGVSNSAFNFNNTTGVFTVPAGSAVDVSVRSDISSSASAGEQVGVQLVSVGANGSLDASVSFPITGSTQITSSATLGTVAMTYTGPSNATENPTNDVRVFEASTVVSTHAARLSGITFEQRGTADDNDLRNFRLYVDGVQVGSAVSAVVNKRVVFDLSSNPLRLETGTRIIKVLADIVGGSSETFDVQVRRAADMVIADAELGQNILVTDAGGSFPVSAGTANNIAGATLSVTRASNTPTENVTRDATNVKIATYEFRASGENVKIEAITVADADTTGDLGLDNGKVFLNGVQIGSTKDIVTAGAEFTFGSSFIARQGQTEIVDIYADIKTSTGASFNNGDSVEVSVAVAAADTEGMDSGNSVTAVSAVESNARTVSASSATLSKATGYGNQTMIAGTNNAKLGSFTISAGSAEGVNVNTITVTLSADEAASITDLTLKDSATGATIGTPKSSPSTSNSFSVNIAIPASGTKTIDLYGNIKTGANAGSWAANVDGSGTGALTASSVTFGSSSASTATLQTITVGSGSITVAAGVSPDNAIVIAGTNDVKVASFKFTAQYSDHTVRELKIKIPNGASTSVSAVTIKWNGGQATQALTAAATTDQYATATYTGLNFVVPSNTEQTLDVYVNIPTIAAGASTGAQISALLADDGFRATDSSGAADTDIGAADLNGAATSGKGTMVVRKSFPTLSAPGVDTSTLSAGSDKVLARVNITANAAGDVGIKKVVFAVTKTAALSLGATTTLALWDGSTQVSGTFATTTGSLAGGNDSLDNLTSGNLIFVADSEQQIAAGTTRTYELRGTIDGIASGYNFVSVRIPQTSTSATTGTFSAIHTAVGEATESLVWTDRSSISTVHSESTSDWTNDYLVKTLPLTVGEKTVTI